MKRMILGFSTVAISALLVACGGAPAAAPTVAPTAEPTVAPTVEPTAEPAASIAEIAAGNPDFSTLVSLLSAAGLVETLSGEGPFTVFAPTNDAFAAVPAEVLEALGADTELLTRVLLYHVAAAELPASAVVAATSATTVEGSDVAISVSGGTVTLNDSATVIATDIEASNGIIHVIDQVILPPDVAEMVAEMMSGEEMGTIAEIAAGNPDFSTLVSLLSAAGLVETLSGEGPFTVFAPTNDAFAAVPAEVLEALGADTELLTRVLLYHVAAAELPASAVVAATSATTVEGSDVTISVDGGTVTLNDSATVIATDIAASNGIIHVIDQVLLPPDVAEMVAEMVGGEAPGTIAEIAAGNPDFSTLVSLLSAAGLVETLSGEGPFTVFAPTNDAFAAVPAETLAALQADPELLTRVLLYHVAAAELPASAVVAATSATTVEGSDVTISVDGGTVTLNDSATVIATDIEASNGIIHVIDQVLLPPDLASS